jgi:hypothetical protein
MVLFYTNYKALIIKHKKISHTVGIAIIHILFWTILFFTGIFPGLEQENGILENTQAAMIFLMIVFFVMTAKMCDKKIWQIFFFSFALLSVTFFLREVDVEDFDLPAIVIWMGGGFGRNLILGTLWLFFFILYYLNFSSLLHIFKKWLPSPPGLTMVLGFFFLFAAVPFDNKWVPLELNTYRFFEEMLELTGYLMMLISAMTIYFNKTAYCKKDYKSDEAFEL